ncbi:MAG: polyisoprenoid-binding protein [Chloroflexi bacterium]|nr:MAG: polyisoprenoid-binding protein [Chloroflexota bacterium]
MPWNIDPAHTLLEFSAKHMMFTTVRGRFQEFSGTINLNEEDITQSSVEGTVNVASITTGNNDRDNHLRSPDFFDVENYPTISFKSTRIERANGNRLKLAGDLTIKDVTREVVFDVTYDGPHKDPWGNRRYAFSGDAALNRKDFGLTWNVPLEAGGWLVGDEIKLHIELQVVEQQG